MRLSLFAGALLVLAAAPMAACTQQSLPPPQSVPVVIERPAATAAAAVADTAASIADALAVAPPATLTTRTTIDEKAVRVAFITFRQTVRILDQWVTSGQLVPGTPRALAIKRGVDAAGPALEAASKAQRAGDARTYVAALREARAAIDLTRVALTQ